MSKVDDLMRDFNKQFKDDILAKGIKRVNTNKLPFSSPRANYMLYGGLPRGRLIEFAGEENGGKTTSALDIVANAQKLFTREWEEDMAYYAAKDKMSKAEQAKYDRISAEGPKKILYADCENTLDEDWATTIGVNTAEMIVIKPQTQTAEEIFEMVLQFCETGEVGLAIVDSLGVMLSSQAYDKTMDEKTYGGIAASLTLFSKKAVMICQKHDCTLIGINQMRENMTSPQGGTNTTGGKGWRHNCSVRLQFKKGDYISETGEVLRRSAEEPSGNLVQISLVKTKVAKPDRKAGFYTLMYESGIDAIADTVDMAIKIGVVDKSGAWFTLLDTNSGEYMRDEEEQILKFQGRLNLIQYLKDNAFIYEEVRDYVLSTIGS